MQTTKIGNQAEDTVAEELKRLGYQILARNWKTKVCEIDIVAKKDNVVYFVEIKFRSSLAQGGGLEYIGPKKLRQLNFAAKVWIQNFNWDGDYRLLAASVTLDGQSYLIENLIEV